MAYKVMYNTQINNEFKSKDAIIDFPKGTDEGYILALIKAKVITETKEEEEEEKKSKKKNK